MDEGSGRMSDSWRSMRAADLGRAIGAKEIDPVALTETFLAAAEAHPEAGRIYVDLTPERARAEAEAAAARARLSTRRHLLDGVPISWKDLYEVAGTRAQAGSAIIGAAAQSSLRSAPRTRASSAMRTYMPFSICSK